MDAIVGPAANHAYRIVLQIFTKWDYFPDIRLATETQRSGSLPTRLLSGSHKMSMTLEAQHSRLWSSQFETRKTYSTD